MTAAKRDSLITADENRAMFDRIAKSYDAANRVISMGLDVGWRRRAIQRLEPAPGGHYLDVGTGTGDLAFELLKQEPMAKVTGIDASGRMLEVARAKAHRRGVRDAVRFQTADALQLPVGDEGCDGIVSGFCFRNIERRGPALEEMWRVLKPGGAVVILEATRPENALARFGYQLYAPLIPLLGRLLGHAPAYTYLVDSIEDFPPLGFVADMLRKAGFTTVAVQPLTMGGVSLFVGRKQKI